MTKPVKKQFTDSVSLDRWTLDGSFIHEVISYLTEKELELKAKGYEDIKLDISTYYEELTIELIGKKEETDEEFIKRITEEEEKKKAAAELLKQTLEFKRQQKEANEYAAYLILKEKYEKA